MKKRLLAGLTAILMTFSMQVFATDGDVLDTFTENNWTKGVAATINTDATYVKDGDTSLCLSYPQTGYGYYLPLIHDKYRKADGGGFPISATMGSQKIKSINIWVYSTVANDALQMKVVTKADANSSNVSSNAEIMNFTGWKLLEFEVPVDATRIYSLEINKVSGTSSTLEGQLYFDSLYATYEYDESEKVALDIFSSLANGAERVSANPEITYTFANAVNMPEEDLKACLSVEPEADYEFDVVDDKAVLVSFSGLTPATDYTVTWTGITDIYEQTASETFTFHTANEFIDLLDGENAITAISQISAGEYALNLSLVNYNEAACGQDCKVVVSFFDNSGVMVGVAQANIAIAEETGEASVSETISGTLSEAPARATVMVMDSWQNRDLVTFMQLGGN